VHAASRYCFCQHLCICLSVCLSAENLENYWAKTDVTWLEYVPRRMLEVVESWWHLTLTFDLYSYFHIFPAQAIPFEWLYLATSFLVWRCIFRISRSQFSFKVMSSRSRSWQRKSCSVQLKNYRSGWTGIITIMLKVIRDFWHFDLWPWDIS